MKTFRVTFLVAGAPDDLQPEELERMIGSAIGAPLEAEDGGLIYNWAGRVSVEAAAA